MPRQDWCGLECCHQEAERKSRQREHLCRSLAPGPATASFKGATIPGCAIPGSDARAPGCADNVRRGAIWNLVPTRSGCWDREIWHSQPATAAVRVFLYDDRRPGARRNACRVRSDPRLHGPCDPAAHHGGTGAVRGAAHPNAWREIGRLHGRRLRQDGGPARGVHGPGGGCAQPGGRVA